MKLADAVKLKMLCRDLVAEIATMAERLRAVEAAIEYGDDHGFNSASNGLRSAFDKAAEVVRALRLS